jgi:hypothetical protein
MAVPGPGDKDKKKKGKTKTTTSTGTPEVTRSKSRITGEDGQEGTRRTGTTTTPTIKKTEFTPEGNKAYAAKSEKDRIAQDKAWTKMSQSKDVKVTNIDNFGARNVQPEGIKHLGPDTKSPKIEIAKGAPRPKAMYEVRGSNIHNMRFGGHSSTQLTDDPNFKGDTSHRLSPSNPISGKPNTSSVTRLSDNVAAAMNTPYNRGRTTGFSEEQATKVNAKEKVRKATISDRQAEINKRKKANTARVKANRNK